MNSASLTMRTEDHFPIIIIGSSTGGPQVLEEIFSRVVRVTGAIIIVQHLFHSFVSVLGGQIHEACGTPVAIPSEGESVCAGTIYLAPGGRHLLLKNNRIFCFSDTDKLHGVRPSIDLKRALRTNPSFTPTSNTLNQTYANMAIEARKNIPTFALAKKRETIYFYDKNKVTSLNLNIEDPVLNLFRNIRDEAHRFATTFHIKKREMTFIK